MISAVALGPRSIGVTWAPPTLANGAIIGYTIYYSPPSSNIAVGGGALSHDLGMLSPHTMYSIRLSASTSAGEGPLSPEGGVAVLTEQDGEEQTCSQKSSLLSVSFLLSFYLHCNYTLDY